MTSFFPDINVWIALSDAANSHNARAWAWLNLLAPEDRLIFSRYTQLGLLRLLANQSVMGEQTLTLREAWGVYDNSAGLCETKSRHAGHVRQGALPPGAETALQGGRAGLPSAQALSHVITSLLDTPPGVKTE